MLCMGYSVEPYYWFASQTFPAKMGQLRCVLLSRTDHKESYEEQKDTIQIEVAA
jgi:hypothetical protein